MLFFTISKNWNTLDYLNYYVVNGHIEYQNLDKFIKFHNISISIALTVTVGSGGEVYERFRDGKYVFSIDFSDEQFSIAKNTIDIMIQLNGHSQYMKTNRFWKALMTLIRHERFDKERWLSSVRTMSERFVQKVSTNDYLKLFAYIYNYRRQQKINFKYEDE
jgi:hypothetical protein